MGSLSCLTGFVPFWAAVFRSAADLARGIVNAGAIT
jgi:hypothetical protein